MTDDIRKYDFINALRGYAILGILLVHSSQYVGPTNRILQLLMAGGARCVQLFYIISALTLCMSWKFRSTHELSPLRNFYIRRFFRIAPIFYIAIIFYLLLYGFSLRYWAPNGIKWWFIPLTALFLNGFHPETITSVVPGGWAIAVLFNFYLIFPFLLKRITTIKSSIVFLAISLIISWFSGIAFEYLFSGIYPENQQYLVSDFIFLNFFSQLPVFAIGILSYFIYKDFKPLKRLVVAGDLLLILSLVLLFLSLPLIKIVQIFSNHIIIGFVLALVALTLSCFPIRLFVNKLITELGKISFCMFLTHFAILAFFSQLGINAFFPSGNISSFLYFLCVVAVTALISYFLNITIERQGILFGKRLINKLEQKDMKKERIDFSIAGKEVY